MSQHEFVKATIVIAEKTKREREQNVRFFKAKASVDERLQSVKKKATGKQKTREFEEQVDEFAKGDR